jgi:hypothetical protein
MCFVCNASVGLAMVVATTASPVVDANTQVAQVNVPDCSENSLYCPVTSTSELAKVLQEYPVPSIATPNTMFANPDFTVKRAITQTVKYQVATKGAIKTSVADFKRQVQETLDDDRGWKRLGVKFEYVESGGAFTMVLAEPSAVPAYGYPCDDVWNCNVGNFVIANEDRWLTATDPWNAAGGTIRDYRHMTVNHELGHWLGHGHIFCTTSGQAAPVMQQQSMDLAGCKFNPWPLDSELHSTRLGI